MRSGVTQILVIAVLLTAVASRPSRKNRAKSGSDSSDNKSGSPIHPSLSTTATRNNYPLQSTLKGHVYPALSTTAKGHMYPAQSTAKGHTYPRFSTTIASNSGDGESKKNSSGKKSSGSEKKSGKKASKKRRFGGAKKSFGGNGRGNGRGGSSARKDPTYPFASTTDKAHFYPTFRSTAKGHTYPAQSTTAKGHTYPRFSTTTAIPREVSSSSDRKSKKSSSGGKKSSGTYPLRSTVKGHEYPFLSTTLKSHFYPTFRSTSNGHTYPALSTTSTPEGSSTTNPGGSRTKSSSGRSRKKSRKRGRGKSCCDCAYNAAMEFLRQLFMKQDEYVRLSRASSLLSADKRRFEEFFSSKVVFPYAGTQNATDYLANLVLADGFAFQQVSLRGRAGCPSGNLKRISVMTTELAFEAGPSGFQPNGAYCKYTVFFSQGEPVKYGRLGDDGCVSVPLPPPM